MYADSAKFVNCSSQLIKSDYIDLSDCLAHDTACSFVNASVWCKGGTILDGRLPDMGFHCPTAYVHSTSSFSELRVVWFVISFTVDLPLFMLSDALSMDCLMHASPVKRK